MTKAFVYVIAIGGEDGPFRRPVNVGITKNPDARLAQIRPCSPLGLSYALIYPVCDIQRARQIERLVHMMLGDVQIAYEWFDTEPTTAAEYVQLIGGTL